MGIANVPEGEKHVKTHILLVEFPDQLANVIRFFLCQARRNGQRKHILACLLSTRKMPLALLHLRIGRLHIERTGIMDTGLDTVVL